MTAPPFFGPSIPWTAVQNCKADALENSPFLRIQRVTRRVLAHSSSATLLLRAGHAAESGEPELTDRENCWRRHNGASILWSRVARIGVPRQRGGGAEADRATVRARTGHSLDLPRD